MRKPILMVGFLMMAQICFAQVSFEIIAKDTDENGNIRVWACHKIDGVEVESRYPKIANHWVWATRYNKQNLAKFTTAKEVEDYILSDIQNYSNALIQKEFDKKAPKTLQQIQIDYNRVANEAVLADKLKDLVGKGLTTNQTIQQIDTDMDGVLDKELTIKPDGTKTEKPYTPVVIETP